MTIAPPLPSTAPSVNGAPSAGDLAIDIHHVAKTYKGNIQALRGVAIQVHRGEVFGLLGPNGAGKSTLVKILMTVISPTECQGTCLGHRVGHKPTLARIGYLPEHHRFPEYLSAPQVLDFFGALHGIDRRTRKSRIAPLLGLVGLTGAGNRKVKGFSKGMRQRLGIAQALINDPDLLLLDEPTDGVDPEGRRDIRMILADLRAHGKAVFINSHILAELEMVCDRAALIFNGLLREQGTMEQLTAFGRCYEIDFQKAPSNGQTAVEQAVGAAGFALGAQPTGEGWGEVQALGENLGRVRLGTTDPARVQPVVDALRRSGAIVTRVQIVRPSLEDVFMRVSDTVRKEGGK